MQSNFSSALHCKIKQPKMGFTITYFKNAWLKQFVSGKTSFGVFNNWPVCGRIHVRGFLCIWGMDSAIKGKLSPREAIVSSLERITDFSEWHPFVILPLELFPCCVNQLIYGWDPCRTLFNEISYHVVCDYFHSDIRFQILDQIGLVQMRSNPIFADANMHIVCLIKSAIDRMIQPLEMTVPYC